MRLCVVIISVFTVYANVFSQNTGYLGKKNSFDLGGVIVPSFTNWMLHYPTQTMRDTGNNEVVSYKRINVKIYPEVSLARTIGRNLDIAVRFSYQTFRVYFEKQYVQSSNPNQWGYNSYENYDFWLWNGVNRTVHTTNFDFNFRYYLGNFIAPVGTYLNFGYGMAKSKIGGEEIIEGGLYDWVYNYPAPSSYQLMYKEELKNETLNMNRVTLGIHLKKVGSNNFYFDGGIETALLIAGRYKFKENNIMTEADLQTYFLGNNVRQYLKFENIAAIRIAMGKVF